MPAKRWPKEHFAELGRLLLRAFPDMELLVLGGKEDKELGDELCREWREGAHNLAGRLSIYGSAAALGACAAYVGNDTGTMHLAAMAGTPCIALFSARDYPGKWDPWTAIKHNEPPNEIPCAGCMSEECTEYRNECLKQIGVNRVFEAVEAVLFGSKN